MMASDDIIKIIAALGIGSGGSALITAFIAASSSKGKSRADAADVLIGVAERVGKLNEAQDGRLQAQDDQISGLKNQQDEIILAMYEYLNENISREQLLERVREIRSR